VESARDILEELQMPAPVPPAPASTTAADARTRCLLDALGYDACDPDTLAARCGLPPAELAALLTLLELDGQIATLPGGLIQRVHR
jgi:DNA processing protein